MIGKKRKSGQSPEGDDFGQFSSYFVSIYTWHGAPLLQDFPTLRNFAETYWENIMGTYSNVRADEYASMQNCLHGIVHIDKTVTPNGETDPPILPGNRDLLQAKHREIIQKAVDFFKSVTEFQWRKYVEERSLDFEGESWQPGVRIIPIRSIEELNEMRNYLQELMHGDGPQKDWE